MKKWKCTVCGYIHAGPEPPETCPVCGAPRDKFEEVKEEASPPPPAPPKKGPVDLLLDEMVKRHAHPISVHFPNGLAPVVVLFLFLSFIFESMGFETAAFYNLCVVALAMPVVLFSGLLDWKRKFKGAWTKVFKIKITCGVIVTTLSLVLVAWRLLMPEAAAAGAGKAAFFVVHLAMLAAAGVAGEYGGRLVFGKK